MMMKLCISQNSTFWRVTKALLGTLLLSACQSTPPCTGHGKTSGDINPTALWNDISYLASHDLAGRKPLSKGSRLAQAYLAERFSQIGLTPLAPGFLHPFSLSGKQSKAANVIGYLPVSANAQTLVFTAHYDHLGKKAGKMHYGADDNASGTAAMLAIADYFSRNKPRHNMLFVATDAEEQGLYGAKAFVDAPPLPLNKVKLNINLDMIARGEKKRRIYIAGTRYHKHLKPYIENVPTSVCIKPGHDKPKLKGISQVDWLRASDHYPFHQKGIPFLYFGVDLHSDYHKPSDTLENIDPKFYLLAVESILTLIKQVDIRYE